jgi:hypothetical protein
MKDNIIEIWLDVLCWETFIKVLFLKKHKIVKVYYFNLSILFSPFVSVIQNIKSITFQQVDDFSQSEQKVGNVTAYEFIRGQVDDKLSEISQRWVNSKQAKSLIKKCNFNTEKVRKYLEANAISYFLRILEMKVVSELRSKSINRIVLIRNSPFSEVFKNEMVFSVRFYRSYISHYFQIIVRKNNIVTDKLYFLSLNKIRTICLIILCWFKYVYALINKDENYSLNGDKGRNSFGLCGEIHQSRVRMNQINDFFWLKSDSIDPGSVSVIGSYSSILDDESKKIIKGLGVQRIKRGFSKSVKYYLVQFLSKSRFQIFSILYWKSVVNIYHPVGVIFKILFKWNEISWIQSQMWRYCYSVFFAEKYFKNNNIRIIFAIDVGFTSLVKSQALENINGFYVSSHWNVHYACANFPLADPKHADIFFVWGSFFVDYILKTQKYLGVFPVGFLLDYYFNDHKIAARDLRAEYPNKFIISYHDNVYGDDIPYSLNLQLDMHRMLITILMQYPHVILFLKPKRRHLYERITQQLPVLNEWEKSGRVRVFLGDTKRTKAVPAFVGMASDLAIGIGISSAAAECYFAGTLAYHADLTGRVSNEFGTKGLGKVVFRDIESLQSEIEDCIENGTQEKYEACRDIYRMLDPFMDGKAYQRVGFILRTLQEQLGNGSSREDAVEATKNRYDEYLREKGYFNSDKEDHNRQQENHATCFYGE